MDMPTEAQRRIAQDKVAWLTTITDRGAPAPKQRPTVTLHFNSDADGGGRCRHHRRGDARTGRAT